MQWAKIASPCPDSTKLRSMRRLPCGGAILASELPKFFDLFSISEMRTPGADLGLGPPVAYRILSLFGASVSVANQDPSLKDAMRRGLHQLRLAGSIHPASGLQHHEVSFYAGCRPEPPSLVYIVFYDYGPSSKRGFVYLPGRGDASYGLNTGTIWHGRGIEGHWFFAADSWEHFVRPLIAEALRRSSSTAFQRG
jgi:hypothetical protein